MNDELKAYIMTTLNLSFVIGLNHKIAKSLKLHL